MFVRLTIFHGPESNTVPLTPTQEHGSKVPTNSGVDLARGLFERVACAKQTPSTELPVFEHVSGLQGTRNPGTNVFT